MTERFSDSIEARKVADQLLVRLRTCKYNPDLHKYHYNLVSMVQQLSMLEVEARQTRRLAKVTEFKLKMEESFSYLEKLMLIQKLMD